MSVYSSTVPNTNSGNYGARLHTEFGQQIQQLEQNLMSENRKKKVDKDIICY